MQRVRIKVLLHVLCYMLLAMIELKGVTKIFGTNKALDGLDLTVAKGEIVGFLGPNGAGKTTTMKIISGFYQQTAGSVFVDGLDILKKSEDIRRKIGYLPETVPLYEDMKVFEYLRFMGEMRDLSPEIIVARLKEVADSCGLSKVMGRPISQLSKGYRQRVGLAQAIIHNPDILILDEPTSGLDPNQIAEIRDLIKQIGKEKTVLFSTHILAEAAATCNRVVIINNGKKIAEGTPEELSQKASDNAYRLVLKANLDSVREKLNSLAGVKVFSAVLTAENYAEIELSLVDKKIHENVAEFIASSAWPVLEFTPKQASLEDVFRQLTETMKV